MFLVPFQLFIKLIMIKLLWYDCYSSGKATFLSFLISNVTINVCIHDWSKWYCFIIKLCRDLLFFWFYYSYPLVKFPSTDKIQHFVCINYIIKSLYPQRLILSLIFNYLSVKLHTYYLSNFHLHFSPLASLDFISHPGPCIWTKNNQKC